MKELYLGLSGQNRQIYYKTIRKAVDKRLFKPRMVDIFVYTYDDHYG